MVKFPSICVSYRNVLLTRRDQKQLWVEVVMMVGNFWFPLHLVVFLYIFTYLGFSRSN